MGDYVDAHGVGRNHTAGELLRIGATQERDAALRALREGDEIAFAAHLFLGAVDPNDTLWGEVEQIDPAHGVVAYVHAGMRDFDSGPCEVAWEHIDAVRRYDEDGRLIEEWPRGEDAHG